MSEVEERRIEIHRVNCLIEKERVEQLQDEYLRLKSEFEHQQTELKDDLMPFLNEIELAQNKVENMTSEFRQSTEQIAKRISEIETMFKDLYEGHGTLELSKIDLKFRKTQSFKVLNIAKIVEFAVTNNKASEIVSKLNIQFLKKIVGALPDGSFELIEKLNMSVKIKGGE